MCRNVARNTRLSTLRSVFHARPFPSVVESVTFRHIRLASERETVEHVVIRGSSGELLAFCRDNWLVLSLCLSWPGEHFIVLHTLEVFVNLQLHLPGSFQGAFSLQRKVA
jgi:hypothetical protein